MSHIQMRFVENFTFLLSPLLQILAIAHAIFLVLDGY